MLSREGACLRLMKTYEDAASFAAACYFNILPAFRLSQELFARNLQIQPDDLIVLPSHWTTSLLPGYSLAPPFRHENAGQSCTSTLFSPMKTRQFGYRQIVRPKKERRTSELGAKIGLSNKKAISRASNRLATEKQQPT
jgi:hypothetical protein